MDPDILQDPMAHCTPPRAIHTGWGPLALIT